MNNDHFFQPKLIALTTSTTVNIPPVTSANALKTDLDVLNKKVSLTNAQTSFNFTTTDNNKQSNNDPTTDITHKEHLYGLGITDDDKNDKAANEAQTSAAQKRLLSDIEAATLLASGKHATETMKCSDESAGRDTSETNKDALNLIGGGGLSSTITDRSEKRSGLSPITSPTSPISSTAPSASITTSTSSTITTNSHTNERRPSWRLKLDSGCKVRNLEPKQKPKKKKTLTQKHSNDLSAIVFIIP